MKLKRIYLGDFGIFQNQILEPLGEGLIVICGPNRAGKSTLMTALRLLGYGIPKGRGIPPAVRQHEIRVDLERDGCGYNIFLDGHAYPRITAGNETPEITVQELYNNLDKFTYRQVFTISLDELNQIPDDAENGEEGKIGAVLLGAGWNEALQLIQLTESLNKEASDLGGKTGKINTRKFQPYYKLLCDGLEMRDRANEQMDEYEGKCSRLEEINKLIESMEKDLDAHKKELQRLELIGDRFEKVQRYKANKRILETDDNKYLLYNYPRNGLEQAESLKEQYEETLSKAKSAGEKFAVVTGYDGSSEFKEKLLQAGGELEGHAIRVSGWEARIQVVNSGKEELEKGRKELERDLDQLCASLGTTEALSGLDAVGTDLVAEQKLSQLVNSHRDLQNELKRQKRDLAELEAELEAMADGRAKLPPAEVGLVRKVALLAGATILAVIGLGFLLPAGVAMTAGITAAVAILAYFLSKSNRARARDMKLREYEKEITDRRTRKEALLARYETIKEELAEVNEHIGRIQKDCRIPDTVEIPFMPDFVRNVRHLQRLREQLDVKGKKMHHMKEELINELLPLSKKLASLNMLKGEYDDIISASPVIFGQLEKSLLYLKGARELEQAERDLAKVESSITELVGNGPCAVPLQSAPSAVPTQLHEFMEQGRRYGQLVEKQQENNTLEQVLLEGLETERWSIHLLGGQSKNEDEASILLAAFVGWCNEFISLEEIKEEHDRIERENTTLEEDLQRLKDEKRDLLREVEELGSDSKLLEAKAQIIQARKEIREILERYTIRRIAGLMLQRTQERLLDKTRDTLLAPAGEVFRKITREAYEKIELPPGGGSALFKARLANGKEQPVDALSRATREQLFFSMRLSRIRDIKPELPVILDDTFTNFDPMHMGEAVKYLVELAKTHQVFVLTCHPELLECLQNCGAVNDAQFWSLNEGRFSGPFNDISEARNTLLKGTLKA